MGISERITRLVTEHEIAVFMKGIRQAPQCGFSAGASIAPQGGS